MDVWVPTSGAPVREYLFDLLARERHVLVVGGRASGKTALAALLAGQAASRDLGFGTVVPLLAPVERLEEPRLDEAEVGRLNPILGPLACVSSSRPGARCSSSTVSTRRLHRAR